MRALAQKPGGAGVNIAHVLFGANGPIGKILLANLLLSGGG
jgi:hypothetical protein